MKLFDQANRLADHFDRRFREEGLDVPRAISTEIEGVVREVTEREFERVLRERDAGSRLRPKAS